MTDPDLSPASKPRAFDPSGPLTAMRRWVQLPAELLDIELSDDEMPTMPRDDEKRALEIEQRATVAIEQWLVQQNGTLTADLSDLLDLNAGQRDAALPGEVHAVVEALPDVLDIDAGLAAIIPELSASQEIHPTTAMPARHTAPATALINAAFAGPPTRRLAARAMVRVLSERNRASGHAAQAVDYTTQIAEFLEQRAQVTGPRARARRADLEALARNRVHRVAIEVSLIREIIEPANISYTQSHITAIGQVIENILLRPNSYSHENIARLTEHVHSLHDSLVRLIDENITELAVRFGSAVPIEPADIGAEELARLLDAMSDLSGADMSEVDLTGIDLEGVRWSSATRWPESWRAQIVRESVPIADDLWEIRPGSSAAGTVILASR
jgi:hypothetical protein